MSRETSWTIFWLMVLAGVLTVECGFAVYFLLEANR